MAYYGTHGELQAKDDVKVVDSQTMPDGSQTGSTLETARYGTVQYSTVHGVGRSGAVAGGR